MSDKLIRLTPNNDDSKEDKENNPKNSLESKSDKSESSQGKDIQDFLSKESSNKEPQTQKRLITKITPQKAKERYNIFIDGEYAFPVAESILIKHVLTKGTHISKAFQKQLESEDSFSKAYTRALNYLSYGLRTEKQVRDDLADNEYDLYADEVIKKLKDLRLINDLEYAKSYIRTQASINRKGPRLIQLDLKQKGVTDLLIDQAMDQYPLDQQIENASHLIKKRMNKPNKSSNRHQLNKINQYLYGKGYPSEVINTAFDLTEPSVDENDEYEALINQANKAYRRYSRKSNGFELKQKLKAYLFGKGYPSDLINKYIDEHVEDEY